jgi:hypothetical protein
MERLQPKFKYGRGTHAKLRALRNLFNIKNVLYKPGWLYYPGLAKTTEAQQVIVAGHQKIRSGFLGTLKEFIVIRIVA